MPRSRHGSIMLNPWHSMAPPSHGQLIFAGILTLPPYFAEKRPWVSCRLFLNRSNEEEHPPILLLSSSMWVLTPRCRKVEIHISAPSNCQLHLVSGGELWARLRPLCRATQLAQHWENPKGSQSMGFPQTKERRQWRFQSIAAKKRSPP